MNLIDDIHMGSVMGSMLLINIDFEVRVCCVLNRSK